MNIIEREPVRKEIDEERAAALLGFTRQQLKELADRSGLGHEAAGEPSERKWFTYEELYRLCRWALRPAA
jgi:hypothetical protein